MLRGRQRRRSNGPRPPKNMRELCRGSRPPARRWAKKWARLPEPNLDNHHRRGKREPGVTVREEYSLLQLCFLQDTGGNERARAKAVHEFLFIRGIFWYFLQDQVREVRCNIYLASYLVSMKETSTPCPEMGLNGKEFSYTDFHIVLISMRILQAEPASLQKPKRVWYYQIWLIESTKV